MKTEDIDTITKLCATYGAFSVVRKIAYISEEVASKMHEDAVIQRDLPILQTAVKEMVKCHLIRQLTIGVD